MKRTFFLLLVALLLSGCNMLSLAYRNADWYLEHRFNDYASFDSAQQAVIHDEVRTYLRWHREQALPQYVVYLKELKEIAQSPPPISLEQARRLRTHYAALYRMTMQPLVIPAAHLMAVMNDSQIGELESHLAGENRKRREESLGSDTESYLERRAKRTLSFLNWLAGSLSKEQEQQVVALSRALPQGGERYFLQREARQRQLIVLLRAHATESEIAAFLDDWLENPWAGDTPEELAAAQSWEQATDKMIVEVHALLTARQKEHLGALATTYIDDISEIVRETREGD